MRRLIWLVLVVGLADSANPSTIGPGLYLAARAHPVRRVLAFTAGAGCVSLLGGVVLTFGPGRVILAFVPHPGPHVTGLIELVGGVALLAASAVLWVVRRGVSARLVREEHRIGRSSAIAGAAIIAVELPTAFPYFAVITSIVGSGKRYAEQLLLLLLFNVAFLSPLVAVAAVRGVAGERSRPFLERVHAVLDEHSGAVLAVVVCVAGVVFIALGLIGLRTG